MKLLVVVSVLIGIFAEQCDIGDLDIAEVADKVVVTNVGSAGTAPVIVKFNHNEVSWRLPPGTSRTASGLAATKYTVSVLIPAIGFYVTYEDQLRRAREDLVALTLDPKADPDKVFDAAAQLPLLVQALQQLGNDKVLQSCSAPLKSGVDGQVTVEAKKLADGTALWALDCR